MSTINKKPFIKSLIEDMALGEITTLMALIDGGGNQTPLLRTMNIKPVGNRTHITVGDKGVHLCDLEANFSLYKGYLIFTDHYCVLIHFTDSQVLGMFDIDIHDLTQFATISEALSVLELRSELNDAIPAEHIEAVEAVREALEEDELKIKADYVDSENESVGKVLVSDGQGGANWEEISEGLTVVELNSTTGTLTDEQYVEVSGDNCIINMFDRIYHKNLDLGQNNVSIQYFTVFGISIITILIYGDKRYETVTRTVEANPVLDGSENLLTSLTVNSTKYKIPQGAQVVEVNSTTGTLTDEQYAILSGDNGILKYNGRYYIKNSQGSFRINYADANPFYYPADEAMRFNCFSIVTNDKTFSLEYQNIKNVRANVNPSTPSELVDLMIGNDGYTVGDSVKYLTTAPVANNTSGRLQIVVLWGEPATRYDGYLYIITEPDAVLGNNSWDTIKSVCEAGDASNYWAVGDEKTDTGTDGITRTFRIVDMSGLYNKHVVFEQVGLEGTDGTGATGVVWDAGNDNDYATSDMCVTVLPNVFTRYSSGLQGSLTSTTVKVAENGNSSTIVDVTNKLFLEAEKEVFGSRTYSVTYEANALTTYSYYVTHNQNSNRVKYNQAGSALVWWLRSPYSGNTSSVCFVSGSGYASGNSADSTYRFAPCFAF